MLVIGAGIMGTSCARKLVLRGMDVTIIDRGSAVGGRAAGVGTSSYVA